MAAHQALPSLGFSRQKHWSGLPFPSPMHESEKWKWSRSAVSDSLWPHGLQPTRLLHPQDFPGKSTGVGCHFLLQRIFLTQGSNPGLPHCRQTLYCLSHQGNLLGWSPAIFIFSECPSLLQSRYLEVRLEKCRPIEQSRKALYSVLRNLDLDLRVLAKHWSTNKETTMSWFCIWKWFW